MRASALRMAVVAGLVLSGSAALASAQTPPPPAPGAAPAQPAPPRFSEIVNRMSTQGQAIMVEAVSKSGHEKKKLKALKEVREQILTLIAEPQLDSEALARALERERVLSQKMQTARHEALLRAATRLSPEDRKIFAEGLRATRLHIPGETVRQIQQKMHQADSKCTGEGKSASK